MSHTNLTYTPYIKILRNFFYKQSQVFKFLEIKPARVVHILVPCFLILMQTVKAYKGLKPQNGKNNNNKKKTTCFLKLPLWVYVHKKCMFLRATYWLFGAQITNKWDFHVKWLTESCIRPSELLNLWNSMGKTDKCSAKPHILFFS